MSDTRQAILLVSPEMLINLFQKSYHPHARYDTYHVSDYALPDDTQFVRSFWREKSHCIALVVTSASFPEVRVGETLPILEPVTFRRTSLGPLVELVKEVKIIQDSPYSGQISAYLRYGLDALAAEMGRVDARFEP